MGIYINYYSHCSSQNRTDLEREVFLVPLTARDPFEDFELVVDPCKHAGMQGCVSSEQNVWLSSGDLFDRGHKHS